ncbi:ATP-dependent DNA ligase [Streptomyces syringium]|uniref:ATP-dependent DNA ligase n=1 Tax=Streptomyces syringium TaxID=76729 RepID=UPI003D8BE976
MLLHPPVEPMLAQARERLPGPGALAGGLAFEPKFDGHRAILFTPSGSGEPVLLQSRRGALIQANFPDLVAAARQLPPGLVLDGELVVWTEGRLSFEALQRRAVAGSRAVAALAREMPAHFIAFDVLQAGEALLGCTYSERRTVLETLFTDHNLAPPWTLCPMSTDPAVAQGWMESWAEVQGVEGCVAKGLKTTYTPGRRGWVKVRRRHTTEAVIGAVTGSLQRPQLLVLGRYDTGRRLRAVGRTTVLKPDAARQLAGHLNQAAPGHPWTGVRFTAAWGSREPLDVLLVAPELVAEIAADTAVDKGGSYRHPLRFIRLRLDVTPADVPLFGEGARPAAG